jgi:hypothetical protein
VSIPNAVADALGLPSDNTEQGAADDVPKLSLDADSWMAWAYGDGLQIVHDSTPLAKKLREISSRIDELRDGYGEGDDWTNDQLLHEAEKLLGASWPISLWSEGGGYRILLPAVAVNSGFLPTPPEKGERRIVEVNLAVVTQSLVITPCGEIEDRPGETLLHTLAANRGQVFQRVIKATGTPAAE